MSPPIFNPDGSEVSEIVLPDGSTASEVIGPDGNVVFEAGPDIPDSGLLHDLSSSASTDATTLVDDEGSEDFEAVGGPSLLTNGINGETAMSYDGIDDAHKNTSFGTVNTPIVIFSVIDLTDNGNWQRLVQNNGTGRLAIIVDFNNDRYSVEHEGSGSFPSTEGGSPTSNPAIITTKITSSEVLLRENGSQQLQTTDSGSTSLDSSVGIGYDIRDGTEYVDGLIARSMVYDESQITSISDIEQALAGIYGVSLA